MYKFTNDCMIGVDVIDEEHRKLFAMINEAAELAASSDSVTLLAVKNMINSLKDYAVNHFKHEEEYMEKTGDAELPRQVREHGLFKEYVDGLKLDDISEENSKEKLAEIITYLAKWLYRHILGSDIMIGQNTKSEQTDIFEFTDEFRMGIEIIDDEHKRLFEIIREANDLISAEFLHDKYDRIVSIITELKDYTQKHFSDEEAYMESIRYEGLQTQKAAHYVFIEMLDRIDLENVDDNQQEYLIGLVDYLISWLSTHILKMDKRIPNNN